MIHVRNWVSGLFLELAQLDSGTDHSHLSYTKVEERLQQHLYFSCVFMAYYRVNHTLFLTYKQYFRNVMISLSLSKFKENVCTGTTVSNIL
jgi:hypothetical protein